MIKKVSEKKENEENISDKSEKENAKPVKKGKEYGVLDAAIAAIKEEYGDDVVCLLAEHGGKFSKVKFVSTGSIDLDSALVRGGVPTGRIVELFGESSSGKTTLALQIVKSALDAFPDKRVLYIDAEDAIDPSLILNMGLDPERFYLTSGPTGEKNLEIAEKIIKTGSISVCVIDSVDSLVPKGDLDKTMDDSSTIGELAKLMSRVCRRWAVLCGQTSTMVIFINQIRYKIQFFGGNPETTPGGNALYFYSSIRIRVGGSGATKKYRLEDKDGNIIGHIVNFHVVKNKLAAPFRTAEVDLIYGKGFDHEGELVRLGVELGLIEKSKTGHFNMNGKTIAHGESAMKELLLQDNTLSCELEKSIRQSLGLSELSS